MTRRPKWLKELGNTRDGVFVVDADQRIVLCNKVMERLLCHRESEVLRRPCHELIGARVDGKSWCRSNCGVSRCAKRGILHQNFDLLTTTKEGGDVRVNVSIILLPTSKDTLVLHLMRDASREAKREELLANMLVTLKRYGVGDEGSGGAPELLSNNSSGKAPSPALPSLTRRESEVLRLLAEGLSNHDIASRLGISPFTVRNHIRNSLRKLGVRNKTEAVSVALRNGFL